MTTLEAAASRTTIMLVAGEASGDLHGAALCRALVELAPGTRLIGMGGVQMGGAGLEPVADARETAVVGITEVVRRLPALVESYRRLRRALLAQRPAALVLIDFPDMNLLLAGVARRAGIPVVYFIPPQIWAWRSGRIRKIRRRVALVLAVLPFETPSYRAAGVPVEFIGHPVVDALHGAPDRLGARRLLGLAPDACVVGLLPGSRPHEVERMLPLMRDAAAQLAAERPGVSAVLAAAPGIEAGLLARELGPDGAIGVVHDRTYAVMRAADVLLVTSGTATLEAALLGTPMVVCYRVSRVSELVGRWLVRVPWISLPNIVLGRAVVPELFRHGEISVERVTAEARRLLDTPGAREAQRSAFHELARQLGPPGVGRRAARLVLRAAGWAA